MLTDTLMIVLGYKKLFKKNVFIMLLLLMCWSQWGRETILIFSQFGRMILITTITHYPLWRGKVVWLLYLYLQLSYIKTRLCFKQLQIFSGSIYQANSHRYEAEVVCQFWKIFHWTACHSTWPQHEKLLVIILMLSIMWFNKERWVTSYLINDTDIRLLRVL